MYSSKISNEQFPPGLFNKRVEPDDAKLLLFANVNPGLPRQNTQMNDPAESFKKRLLEKYGKNPSPIPTIELSSTNSNENEASFIPFLINTQNLTKSCLDNVAIQKPIMNSHNAPDSQKIRESDADENNATLINSIRDNGINCISLLNEICSKVKKRVDYNDSDVPGSKVKNFECICLYDKCLIGRGRGFSKPAAKNQASIAAVETLIKDERYVLEKAHITLSVQKLVGIGPVAIKDFAVGQNQNKSTTNTEKKTKETDEQEESLMNDSALYELNQIAKELFIEPRWKFSPPGGPNGEFEVEVIFDKLVAIGKGRKKLDAKRAAALCILRQIRGSSELSQKYDPKAKKNMYAQGSGLLIENMQDDIYRTFVSCVPASLQKSESSSLRWKESLVRPIRDFGDFLEDIWLMSILDEDMQDILNGFFKVIQDHTMVIASSPKQVLLDASQHMADYITNVSLVPVGSFALGCMRRHKLDIDTVLLYTEVKQISKRELSELYRQSMQKYQTIISEESHLHFELKIEDPKQGSVSDTDADVANCKDECLVLSAGSVVGRIRMKIRFANLAQIEDPGECQISVQHIQRVYDSFPEHHQRKVLRKVLHLIRQWKDKNYLPNIPIELLDVLVIEGLLNEEGIHSSIGRSIINLFILLTNETCTEKAIQKAGKYYYDMYKKVPFRSKLALCAKSSLSLDGFYNQNFNEAGFI